MIKEFNYKTHGTCSTNIKIVYDSETKIIKDVEFTRGCQGNTLGVATLCKNHQLEEIRDLLKGIKCGAKSTSCPNELSKAIDEILKNN